MLKIVTVPDKILTTPTKPVNTIDSKIKNLVRDMEKTLDSQVDPQGVGLAAPQVGVALSLFIIKPSSKTKTEVFINPKIIKLQASNFRNPASTIKHPASKKKRRHKLEGCLSIPKIWSPVKRAKKILLEYQTFTGEKKTEWFSGFKSIIIEHEIDHLKGVLFTQRAIEQKSLVYEEKEGKLEKLEY